MNKSHLSDSSVFIGNDVNIKGDYIIGSNSKIIKASDSDKKLSLFEILVGITTLIAAIAATHYPFKKV